MASRDLAAFWRRSPHPALVAALVAASVALPALWNGFVLDDVYVIAENHRVHSLEIPWRFFALSYWPPDRGAALYRPVTVLGFALQWALGGGSPAVFHLVSLLLAAGTAAAVAWLALSLGLGRVPALTAGVLFAIHPVHVEAVANVVGQGELLAALAVLTALILYLHGRRRGALTRPAICGIMALAGAGCLSKEHASVLPALLVVAELTAFPGIPLRSRARLAGPTLAGLGVVVVVFWTVRTMVLGGVLGVDIHPVFRTATAAQRLLTSLAVVPTWVRLFLFPLDLKADYSPAEYQLQSGFGFPQLLGLSLVVGAAAIAWRCWRRQPVITAGILFAGIALGPVSNVLLPTGIIVAERVLFLPSVGVVLAVSAALAPLLEGPRRLPTLAAVGTLAALGGARSMMRAPVWASTEALSANMLVDAPRDYRSWWMVGGFAFKRGQREEGTAAYRHAVDLFDGDPNLLVDVADVELVAGRYREAEVLYRRAVTLVPAFQAARSRLILALVGLGRCREARDEARMAAQFGDIGWRRRLAFVDSVAVAPRGQCDVPPSPASP